VEGSNVTDPHEVIRTELGPAERLLWAGPARTGIILRAADAVVFPFVLLWCGGVIYGLVETIVEGGPQIWIIVAVASAFLLGGLYLLVGRFLVDARRRGRTTYGVSSERIVIISGLFQRVVRSLNLDLLADVVLTERADGSGTITFGPLSPWAGWYSGQEVWVARGLGIPQFELASDVRRVYEVILGARRALRPLA
jgi:hypothetical protein